MLMVSFASAGAPLMHTFRSVTGNSYAIGFVLTFAFVCALAGCASPQTRAPTVTTVDAQKEALEQKKLVVRSQIEQNTRLQRVAHQILVAGADFCKEKVGPKFGFSILSDSAFDDGLIEAARAEGLRSQISVIYVVPGSTADKSGIHAGDELRKIGEWSVPGGSRDSLETTIGKLKEWSLNSGSLPVTLARNGVEVKIDVPPDRACDFNVAVGAKDAVNAYADGENIVIEKGMMRFAQQDEELALVLAHELAHNAMGHISSKRTNAVVGGAVGFLVDVALVAATAGAYSNAEFTRIGAQAGAGSYSVEFEQEADYVGMYILKRASYDISEAPDFWRRMAIDSPESIELRNSHPTTPERFVGLQSTLDEISKKIDSGAPLMPEMKH